MPEPHVPSAAIVNDHVCRIELGDEPARSVAAVVSVTLENDAAAREDPLEALGGRQMHCRVGFSHLLFFSAYSLSAARVSAMISSPIFVQAPAHLCEYFQSSHSSHASSKAVQFTGEPFAGTYSGR